MMKKFNYKLLENIEGDNWRSLENKSLKIRNITKSLIFSNKYIDIHVSRIYTFGKGWDNGSSKKIITFTRKGENIQIPISNFIFDLFFNFKRSAFLSSLIILDETFLKIEIVKNLSKVDDENFPSKVSFTVPKGKTPLDYTDIPWYCGEEII